MPAKRNTPNIADPLSEPSPQRRLWAAYLRAGFTRAQFARLLEVQYHTLDAWDTESRMPDLVRFAKAAQLVGVSVDELLWGHGGMSAARGPVVESALSVDGVRALLDQLRATASQCAALAEHRESIRGQYARLTPTYVRTFVAAYAAAVERGVTHPDARLSAATEAENAQANADAHARGVRAVPPERAATMAERVTRRLHGQREAQAVAPKRARNRRNVRRPAKQTRQRAD